MYLTIHGSKSYNLHGPTSDTDKRGYFYLDADQFFGLKGGPETLESNKDGVDFVAWEFRKFMKLAANSNPNVIETLFTAPTDVIAHDGTVSWALRNNAQKFLSKKVAITFGGYARQNFTRLGKNIDKWKEDSGVRKDAMHCMRLIGYADQILTTGNLVLPHNEEARTALLNIRLGKVPPVTVLQMAEAGLNDIDVLAKKSALPEEPDHEWINQFTIDTLKARYL